MSEKDNDIMYDLANYTTLNGDDIIEILMSYGDDEINDYVWCWKQRISEEIQRRIETGVITPFRDLSWCIRGIGWGYLNNG